MASSLQDMNSSFKSSDVEKLTGIKRTRLQQWLEQGFIVPSIKKASGAGTQNLYDINDLARIVLFKKIIEVGFPRKTASDFIVASNKIISTGLPSDIDFLCIDYLIFCRKGGDISANIAMLDEDVMSRSGEFLYRMFEFGVSDIYILNARVILSNLLRKFGREGERFCCK